MPFNAVALVGHLRSFTLYMPKEKLKIYCPDNGVCAIGVLFLIFIMCWLVESFSTDYAYVHTIIMKLEQNVTQKIWPEALHPVFLCEASTKSAGETDQ